MKTNYVQWFISRYKRIVNSIAFYPALIATIFLGLSVLMVYFDSTPTGKAIKSDWQLLRLKDATTARSIISAIAAGLISLTVFSFSMVMIVLNQAASQMSNRILDKLIGNRFQQFVLGFYIGTIVYSLFLLSTIRDIDDGIYVPSLSTYLLIALTIMDIFLFIYFLHYITQSVKYEIIISRIHQQTKDALMHTCRLDTEPAETKTEDGFILNAPRSGIFSGVNKKGLLAATTEQGSSISFLFPLGSFILKEAPFILVSGIPEEKREDCSGTLMQHIFISTEENIDDDFNYGLRQLMEVAVKALSPGINDPGTAVTSLRSLVDLLSYRLKHYPNPITKDDKGIVRIRTQEYSFEQIFGNVLFPIWDYGKNDRLLQHEMRNILTQLQSVQKHPAISQLLAKVQRQIVLFNAA